MTSAPSRCVFRPASIADLGEIAGMLHAVFGVRRTVETLRWKYAGGCRGTLAGSVVATDGERVVGFLGQVPVRIRVNGCSRLAAQGADAAILESHRRLDVFLGLVRQSLQGMAAAGIDYAYGTPSAEAAGVMDLMGQAEVARLPLLVKPLSSMAAPSAGYAATAVMRALACLRRRPRLPDGHRLVRLSRFDHRADALWRRVGEDYPVRLVRDAAFLNWRYAEAPGSDYECLGLEDASGGLAGYAVLGMAARGGQARGRICDLVSPRRGDPRVTGVLLDGAVQWLRNQGADVAEIWAAPGSHVRRVLLGRGFLPRSRDTGGLRVSVLSAVDETERRLIEKGTNWCLSLGDSDRV